MKTQIGKVHQFLTRVEGLRIVPPHKPHVILRGWHVLKTSSVLKHRRYHLVIEEIPKPAGDLLKYEILDRSVDMRYVWQVRLTKLRVEKIRSKFGIVLRDFEEIFLWSKGDPLDIALDIEKDIDEYIFSDDQVENMDAGDMARRIESETTRHRRPPRKLIMVMEFIYSKFANTRAVPAREFDELFTSFSKPLITKAKQTMHIESVRKDGIWYWAHPLLSPQPALQALFRKRQEEAMDILRPAADWRMRAQERPSVLRMKEIMDSHGYSPMATTVYNEMSNYSRPAILKAKQALGVMSYKDEGEMYWVWPAPHIRRYYIDLLSNGPVAVNIANQKYGRLVTKAIKYICKGITTIPIHGALYLQSDVSGVNNE